MAKPQAQAEGLGKRSERDQASKGRDNENGPQFFLNRFPPSFGVRRRAVPPVRAFIGKPRIRVVRGSIPPISAGFTGKFTGDLSRFPPC
jgi:hypothetical protein